MTLGQVIRHYRRERKLTQEQLAERLGRDKSQSLVSRWEKDEREPSLTDLGQIARVLEIPLSVFIEPLAAVADLARAEG